MSDEEAGPDPINRIRAERAARYDIVRQARERRQEGLFTFLKKTHFIECIVGVSIYFICPLFARGTKNYYTLNHLEYNKLIALTLIKWDLTILTGIFLKDNFG